MPARPTVARLTAAGLLAAFLPLVGCDADSTDAAPDAVVNGPDQSTVLPVPPAVAKNESPAPAFAAPADGPFTVGDLTPDLPIPVVLNGGDVTATSLGDLRGQTVIVENWATWCTPCIAAIPHMNELTEQFAGDPGVRFVSVTSEDRETVEPFLEDHPIAGWVGLDADDAFARAFGITGIPTTLVIAPDGRLVVSTHPMRFTAGMIEAVRDGVTVRAERRPIPAFVVLAGEETKLEEPGPDDFGSYERGERDGFYEHVFRGAGVDNLLGVLAGTGRPVQDETGLNGRYNVTIRIPEDANPAEIAAAFEEATGLIVEEVEREAEYRVVEPKGGGDGWELRL